MLSVLSALDLGLPAGRSYLFVYKKPSSFGPSIAGLVNTVRRWPMQYCLCRRFYDRFNSGHLPDISHGFIIGMEQPGSADTDASLRFIARTLISNDVPAVLWTLHPRLHHSIASRHKDVLSNLEVHFYVDPPFLLSKWILSCTELTIYIIIEHTFACNR